MFGLWYNMSNFPERKQGWAIFSYQNIIFSNRGRTGVEGVVKITTIFLRLTGVKKVKKSLPPLLCSVLTEVESFWLPLFDKVATRVYVRTLDRKKRKKRLNRGRPHLRARSCVGVCVRAYVQACVYAVKRGAKNTPQEEHFLSALSIGLNGCG